MAHQCPGPVIDMTACLPAADVLEKIASLIVNSILESLTIDPELGLMSTPEVRRTFMTQLVPQLSDQLKPNCDLCPRCTAASIQLMHEAAMVQAISLINDIVPLNEESRSRAAFIAELLRATLPCHLDVTGAR